MLKNHHMKTTTTALFLCCFFAFQTFDQVIGQDCEDSFPNCAHWKQLCSTLENVRSACPKSCETCVSNGAWSRWRRWSECSASCDGGTQTRKRICRGNPTNCPGDDTEERDCNKKACPTEDCKDPANWCKDYKDSCDTIPYVGKTCILTCGNCDGGGSTGWTQWTSWMACSVTCGVGIQERTRTCQGGSCPGLNTETQDCESVACPGGSTGWTQWTSWMACSVTCGGGIQERTRTCQDGSCPGYNKETQDCESVACPGVWEYWSEWATCSVSCGGGTQQRTRTCSGSECDGADSESRQCLTEDCPGGGGDCEDEATWCAQYSNYCNSDNDYVQKNCKKTCNACSPGNFKWSDWTAWSCAVTCGTGIQTRTRECQEGDCEGETSETQSCRQGACPPDETGYGPWTDYGKCSQECGGGVLSRTRTCLSGQCTKHSTEIRNCNEQECADDNCEDQPGNRCSERKAYSQCQDYPIVRDTWCPKTCGTCTGGGGTSWGQYGPCSVSCGVGLKTRTKDSGQDRALHISQSITCFEPECGTGSNWNTWAQWSECSKTCSGGKQTRERTCPQADACLGPSGQTRDCGTPACATWNPWGSWGECSASCGPGEKTRSRTCSVEGQCDGLGTSEVDCKLKDCEVAEWTDWSDWSTCTKPCGVGKKKRSRSCSIPGKCGSLSGESEEEEVCNTNKCPEWEDWSDWSTCTKPCGVGKSKRIRSCSIPGKCGSLSGESEEEEDCNTDNCPAWKAWGPWAKCSRTCGTGNKERVRTCSVPNECDGKSKQSKDCNDKPCGDISNWSTCSKSCGGGTSKRFRSRMWQFRACGNGACARVSCSTLTPLLRNKYGPDKSKCCNKVHMPSGEQCGRNEDERRIIGGVDSDKKRWPWTVGLYSMNNGFCGGTLISSRFVVSAAHCFAEDNGMPLNVTGWQWVLGTLDLSNQRSYERIKNTTIHPDYSYPYNDIAITEFAHPVRFDNYIYPLCLPHGEETPFDSMCYVVGWGVSTIPEEVTSHMQQAAIHNYDPRVCMEAYGKHASLDHHLQFLKNNKGYLCAGSLTKEVDSCSGDSGGPLLCQRCDSCSWYLAGVVSFGPNPCAFSGVPAIYTKVVHYEEWIIEVAKLTKHNLQCKNAA